MNFNLIVSEAIKPLIKMGFVIIVNELNHIKLQKEKLIIEMYYETSGYEICTYFSVSNSKINVSLSQVIEFYSIKRVAMYQLPNQTKESMEKGVKYTVDTICGILLDSNFQGEESLKTIEEKCNKRREYLLKKYYICEELKSADYYWKNEHFDKAYDLYNKHKENLSKVQRKRLQIAKRKRNCL